LNEKGLNANFLVAGNKWLKAKNLQKGDRLFIYLAGHGDAIDESQYYYLTYDCNPAGDKANYQIGGAMSMYDVKANISRQTAKGVEVYLIVDACRSNELPGKAEGQNFFSTGVSDIKAGEVLMMAAQAGQESLEDRTIGTGHGLFTYYLIDGLSGMADAEGTKDNKITVQELQEYLHKKVPAVAQQQFKRDQVPYFCCTENSSRVISLVDTAYMRKWLELKSLQKKTGGTSFTSFKNRKKANTYQVADTTDPAMVDMYNKFNNAIKESRLIGDLSAEYYYNKMEARGPNNSYTIDAQTTLSVEFINFAQSKINLYLDCKDASSVQKLRAQIDEDEKTDEIASSLDGWKKWPSRNFMKWETCWKELLI
jgi:hypothetical protein